MTAAPIPSNASPAKIVGIAPSSAAAGVVEEVGEALAETTAGAEVTIAWIEAVVFGGGASDANGTTEAELARAEAGVGFAAGSRDPPSTGPAPGFNTLENLPRTTSCCHWNKREKDIRINDVCHAICEENVDKNATVDNREC